MKLSQRQTQVQKQIMAPVMQQSIEILMLPILDLETAIDQHLEENPFLEIDETLQEQQRHDAEANDPKEASISSEVPFSQTISDEIQNLMNAPDHQFLNNTANDSLYEEFPFHSAECTLEERLLRQIHIDLTDPLKIRIAEMIIGQLNEDGYLTTNCTEIAQALGLNTTQTVEDVLSLIQTYEPAGIAARSLQECLTLQANAAFNGKAPLAIKIIQDHLGHLGRKRYDLIAKNLKITIDQVRHWAQLIATLDPRPARNFRPLSESNYIKPDIFIYKDPSAPDNFTIEVNSKGVPPLRINPFYKKLMRKKNLSSEEKIFLREKLQNAAAFIKSIQQRGNTMKEIGDYILRHQEDFFHKGHAALKPMGLKDVAAAIDRNESTISRAIHQKYIDTPQGILPLKYFFSQSVGNDCYGNGGTSNRSVKEEIWELVEDEDKAHPLSDSEILQLLAQKGIKVARRTIGKYRQQLNILPSHLRKV
jgi:RNA polymerase sigma-54 factor